MTAAANFSISFPNFFFPEKNNPKNSTFYVKLVKKHGQEEKFC